MILLPLLLLHFSSADYLSDHLTHNVDLNVNPCENFYLHVCSQSVDQHQFPFEKIEQFYQNISKEHAHVSGSRNFAILNDLAMLREITEENKPVFNKTLFRSLLESRCAENDECYRKEFKYFYNLFVRFPGKINDRLKHLFTKIDKINRKSTVKVLIKMIDSLHSRFHQFAVKSMYYSELMNRLFVMEELKRRGIFEEIENLSEDLSSLKSLIIERFRNTPWMNEKDELGLSLLAEFKDKVNELVIHYDLDEDDNDLELLREINSKFMQNYYLARQRSTGVEVLDILLALREADRVLEEDADPEEKWLIRRVQSKYESNAFYNSELNRVAMLAPLIYPKLADNDTLNKPYSLFATLAHEIYHSVINKTWAERSDSFQDEMECYYDHFNKTCTIFGEKSCNSGPQTFQEDGPDIEGLRVAYDFFLQNYDEEELMEEIFKSDSFSVDRQQSFFYLNALFYCAKIDPDEDEEHEDVHSYHKVRVNGDMTQMPEFSKAFSCTPKQLMYSTKEDTCNLFGPDSK